jgi:putative membrane protein
MEKGGNEMNILQLSKLVPRWAAVALLISATTMAQMPGGSGGQMTPGQQTLMPGQPNAPGNNPQQNLPGMDGNSMASFADQSFVRKTLEDNQAQVQMGQLAAQKSSSADVKQFGEKMAEIHQKLSDQLKPVAQKLGVSEPKEPSKKDKLEIAKMQTLSGADFDTAFIKAMMREQQSDLKDFKSEAQSAQDPAVQQLAQSDAPVLSQHLQILEQLAQAHNVTVESKD